MRHGCCEWMRLISSAVGVLVGIVAFILFFIVWGNHSAGAFALTSGVFAAVCFHLILLHFRDMLETWYNVETLQGMTLLGVLGSLAGAGGLAWYLFVSAYYHIPTLPISDSTIITSVWAGMTLKYGLTLITVSRCYTREMYRETSPLLGP